MRGKTAAVDEDQEQRAEEVPTGTAEPARPAPPATLPRQHNNDPLRPPREPYLRGLGRSHARQQSV
ncbi:hypothetical protein [Kitasatospora sp. HPMI-4]|uniref:hypothetical protein n=1 Tax=Kitasatospora sp. HPMI-4 TaxID=3448443 RepID=UPI003F1D4AFA